MSFLDILKQYAGDAVAPPGDVHAHFDDVARQAAPADLGSGIAAAFRSDSTPPFGQLVGNLFDRSNPQQQAGVVDQLVQALGTGGLASVAGGLLGRVLGKGTDTAATSITPEQASQLSPTDVATIAAQAEKQDPSIVDRLGNFYAQHPTLVKTLGVAALGIAMRHMNDRR
ncbi:MAG: hypothetical protein ABI281_04485 [Caldimonas sp.]